MNLLQKTIIKILINRYIEALKEFYNKKYIIVRGVNCGKFESLHKIDALIYLLTEKKIDKNYTKKLINEFEEHGFNRIPSMNIRSLLYADIAITSKQQNANDEVDLDRAATGLFISDYFFADNEKKITIEKYKLDKQYNTKVFSGKKDSILALTDELSYL